MQDSPPNLLRALRLADEVFKDLAETYTQAARDYQAEARVVAETLRRVDEDAAKHPALPLLAQWIVDNDPGKQENETDEQWHDRLSDWHAYVHAIAEVMLKGPVMPDGDTPSGPLIVFGDEENRGLALVRGPNSEITARLIGVLPKLLELLRHYCTALNASDSHHHEFLDSNADVVQLLWEHHTTARALLAEVTPKDRERRRRTRLTRACTEGNRE